jgi:hypothetical protein
MVFNFNYIQKLLKSNRTGKLIDILRNESQLWSKLNVQKLFNAVKQCDVTHIIKYLFVYFVNHYVHSEYIESIPKTFEKHNHNSKIKKCYYASQTFFKVKYNALHIDDYITDIISKNIEVCMCQSFDIVKYLSSDIILSLYPKLNVTDIINVCVYNATLNEIKYLSSIQYMNKNLVNILENTIIFDSLYDRDIDGTVDYYKSDHVNSVYNMSIQKVYTMEIQLYFIKLYTILNPQVSIDQNCHDIVNIYLAIKANMLDYIKSVDINKYDSNQCIMLSTAIIFGRNEIFEHICNSLHHYYSVASIISWCCKYNRLYMIKYFINSGCDWYDAYKIAARYCQIDIMDYCMSSHVNRTRKSVISHVEWIHDIGYRLMQEFQYIKIYRKKHNKLSNHLKRNHDNVKTTITKIHSHLQIITDNK